MGSGGFANRRWCRRGLAVIAGFFIVRICSFPVAAEQLGVLQHALALASDDAEDGPGGAQAGDDEDQIGSHILKIGQKGRADLVDALQPQSRLPAVAATVCVDGHGFSAIRLTFQQFNRTSTGPNSAG